MDEQRQDDQLRTYIQQLCADTVCSLKDEPEAMDDREGWRGGSGISVLMVWHDDDLDWIIFGVISYLLLSFRTPNTKHNDSVWKWLQRDQCSIWRKIQCEILTYNSFNCSKTRYCMYILCASLTTEMFFLSLLYLVWFGLVSLFNGIWTFVDYLMPKVFSQKNSSGTV